MLTDAIELVGPSRVTLVITDSAAVCKAAGSEIERAYPAITWLPCTAHALDLLLEDMGTKVFFFMA